MCSVRTNISFAAEFQFIAKLMVFFFHKALFPRTINVNILIVFCADLQSKLINKEVLLISKYFYHINSFIEI